ncbi:hypothetical protein CLV51_107139 [Chitinophaga niastensis]|uniref:Uncharacterized protein n=1 Tax=Chitinophaga niastensis TaxID=536980 RepID=A0A2P8HC73_CHINA|nr:hypothetical protein [Chitinophaga niastensis]PSL43828.1 hypothetical protein CLV51_107139 [Chitinophaga niastensis]
MKKSYMIGLISLFIIAVSIAGYAMLNNSSKYATCSGDKGCNACKNCKYCKHCSKDGGTCGVCK